MTNACARPHHTILTVFHAVILSFRKLPETARGRLRCRWALGRRHSEPWVQTQRRRLIQRPSWARNPGMRMEARADSGSDVACVRRGDRAAIRRAVASKSRVGYGGPSPRCQERAVCSVPLRLLSGQGRPPKQRSHTGAPCTHAQACLFPPTALSPCPTGAGAGGHCGVPRHGIHSVRQVVPGHGDVGLPRPTRRDKGTGGSH